MTELIQGRKGGSTETRTPTVDKNDLLSVSKTKLLLAICNGEIAPITAQDIYLDGTPVMNTDGEYNFTGVVWDYRPGVQDQSYIKGIPGTENEISINTDVTTTQSWVRGLTNTQLSAVRITFSVPAIYEQKDNGDVVGSYAAYVIEVSTDGAGYFTANTGAFDGKATSQYQRSVRINLPDAETGWTIRVRRTTPDSTSDRIVNAFGIFSYAEIVDAKFRYPLTALLFIEFDAENFNNVPAVSVMAKRIIRVPNNYDPVTRTYTGTWAGDFKYAHTDNPAWVFYDLITNDLYALGDTIPTESTNLTKYDLYEIAQYCDQLVPDGSGGSTTEPRFTCNAFIQTQNDAYTVLNDFAAIFRGATYWYNDRVNIVCDMPADYGFGFNNTNIVGGEFGYTGGSVRNRYSQAIVGYSDPTNHYTDMTKVSQVQSLVRRYGVKQAQVTAIGCTRESEANRKGLYYLYTNQLDEQISFSTGLEGYIPYPGMIMPVADTNRSGADIGGRVITATSARVINLDRAPRASAGSRFLVNLPDGTSGSGIIQSINGKTVTLTVALPQKPNEYAAWLIDSEDLAVQLYRCVSVTDNNDNTFNINAIIHNESKYAAIDTGARLEFRPVTVTPSSTMQIPKNIVISSYSFIEQTMAITTMRVVWDKVEGAVKYEAQWKKDNNDWVNASPNSSAGFEVRGIYAGVYQARVRSINSGDVSSAWGYAPATTLTGKDGAPPMPQNFRATDDQIFAIQLDWNIPTSAGDANYTEIQYSSSSTGADATLLSDVSAPTHQYIQAGLRAGVTFFYRARLVDKTGNQSPWTDWVMGQSTFDANAIIDVIDEAIRDSDAFEALSSNIDTNIEGMLQNALDNNSSVDYQFKFYGNNKAEILNVKTTTADQFGAVAQQMTQVQASVASNVAAINQTSTAVANLDGKLSAQYGVKVQLNSNGQAYVAGMQLGIQGDGTTVQSYALFNADTFAVYNGTGTNNSLPFVIQGGQVFIRDAFIADGAITNAKIGAFIQSTNYVVNSAGWRLDKGGTFENYGSDGDGAMKQTNTTISVRDGSGVLRFQAGKITGSF